jgi:hypothetical protein
MRRVTQNPIDDKSLVRNNHPMPQRLVQAAPASARTQHTREHSFQSTRGDLGLHSGQGEDRATVVRYTQQDWLSKCTESYGEIKQIEHDNNDETRYVYTRDYLRRPTAECININQEEEEGRIKHFRAP